MSKTEEKNTALNQEEILANATKQTEEILAKLAKAEKKIAELEAKEKAAEKSLGKEKLPYDKRPEILAEIKRGEEKVKFRLVKDSERYKDDVYISIGGNNILLKRGVNLLVPRKFVSVLEQSKAQNLAAMAYIEEIEGKNIEYKG